MKNILNPSISALRAALGTLALAWLAMPVFAAQTDISSTPLASTTSAQVKPNIMLLMDTSGSMGWGHMPDEVEGSTGIGSVGYKSAQCNVLYYNRNQVYLLPKKPDGSLFAAPNFSSAPYAGYVSYYAAPDSTDTSTVDLGSKFKAYDSKTLQTTASTDVAQPAYYYYYTGTQTLTYAAPPCTDSDTGASRSATGGGTWTRVLVSATSGVGTTVDERQNFAIWYSYYRTRMSLTKSAASLAFSPLTDSFRVGFITVKPKDLPSSTTINSAKYLAINDFGSSQRALWFDKLFSQAPDGSSPAREGLARVGRHYAGMQDGINAGMTGDPVQYSCQQNFTIMTTDGYWNAQSETPNGGPVMIDGHTLVGRQDNSLTDATGNSPPPIWDGSVTSVRTDRDSWDAYKYDNCNGPATFESTSQALESHYQIASNTNQTSKTTKGYTTTDVQNLRNTNNYTTQSIYTERTTQQYLQSTFNYTQGTNQLLVNTENRQLTTEQYTTSTRQIYEATYQYTNATSQTTKTSLQYSSGQTQTFQRTYHRQSTQTRYTQGQTQTQARTYQHISYDGSTERSTPVKDACTSAFPVQCYDKEVASSTPSGPAIWTVVASCTPGQAAGPSYVITECKTVTIAATAAVASCTPGSTNSGSPNYITTTCTNEVVAPTAYVASCTPGTTTSAAPAYVTTVCTEVPITAKAPGDACTTTTGAGPNYVTTECTSTVLSAVTPVASCSAVTASSANDWKTTSCTKTINTSVFVASTPACVDQTAGSGNAYTKVTCSTATTPATPVNAVCTAGTTVDANYKYTTCGVNTIVAQQYVATTTVCTASFGAGPNYYHKECGATASSAQTPVAPCTVGTTVGAGPSYVQTTCAKTINTSVYVKYASWSTCVDADPVAPNYKKTRCTIATTPQTGVTSCQVTPAAANGSTSTWDGTTSPYTHYTCTRRVVAAAPIANCTPGTTTAPDGTVTTCAQVTVTPEAGVISCTVGDTVGPAPQYLHTFCRYRNDVDRVPQPASNCVAQSPNSANKWTTVSCVTVNPPAAASPTACTPGTTNNGSPNYVYTTCTKTPGAVNEPVATCTAGTGPAPDYTITDCPAAKTWPAVGVASCTDGATVDGPGPAYIHTTCKFNNSMVYVPDVASCTEQSPTSGNGYVDIKCNTTTTTTKFVSSCSAGSSGSPSYVNTVCNPTSATTPTPVASCTAGVGAGPAYLITSCTDGVSTPAKVVDPGTCTAGVGPAPDYIKTTCTSGTAPGFKRTYTTTLTTTVSNISGSTVLGVPVVTTSTSNATETDGVCYITGVSTPVIPALPAPNPQRSAAGGACPSGWPCSSSVDTKGGSENSLADVAQYYYVTDLRPGKDWPDNVPSIGSGPEDDRNPKQHMTTFTIALGVSGTLSYRSDYRSSTALTGDFADIRTTAKSWPIWPDPTLYAKPMDQWIKEWDNPRSIDDFWHAAVNGRGQYFSAGNPSSVIAGLSGALAGIEARLSAGAAAGTSTLEPVVGDNFVFLGSYTTTQWTGDLQASTIDTTTGLISPTVTWSAQLKLDQKTSAACDSRNIYLMRPGVTTSLVNFTWDSQRCDADGNATGSLDTGLDATEMGNFDASKVVLLSHYPTMTDGSAGSVDQRTPAAGAKLVNFLRGQRGNEGFEVGAAGKLYRSRVHVLGDVVGAQPVYVKAPFATYQDAGYDAFKSSNSARVPMVYVAANDGMLHAFDAATGQESWAIIPSTVLPNLYKLADNNYKNVHQFYVDGTPVVGDIRGTAVSSWKSLLVGGLNAGGKGYYAVDVTDPASPKAMWEFKFSSACYDGSASTADADCHLGLTFGKPIITKVKDSGYSEGRWVVLISSGYNNVRGAGLSGDGKGYLYVLDANTGKILYKIDTSAGDAATPSNLGQLNTYVDDGSVNNTALRAYGADMLGNVWRFDVNDSEGPSGRESILVGQAKDKLGAPQPITVRPELAELNGKPMVFVATGRMLGTTDIGDTQGQSIYGIVDPLVGSPVYSDLRNALKPMVLTQVGSGTTAARTVACSTVAGESARCSSKSGWVIDLPDSGERVNVDMKLALTTLVVGSNVPTSSACSTGGYSWLNYVDFASGTSNGSFGGGTGTSSHVSQYSTNSLIVGLGVYRLPSGDFKTGVRISGGGGIGPGGNSIVSDLYPPSPAPKGKRISWREIAQ